LHAASSDDDDDDDDDFELCDTQQQKRRRKKNKYYSNSSSNNSSSNNNSITTTTASSLNLKDPMMSASHSPSHFSNDLNNYMDHMFFSSSQFLSMSADDSIDLCTILKTESALGYDNDMIMIG